MARCKKEDSEKTYHALLDAATLIFSQQGVAKTTLNEIAKSAGVTRGAIYWHFENKDALIKGLWKRCAGVEVEAFLNNINNLPDENPLEYFVELLQEMLARTFSDQSLNQSLRIITSSMDFTDADSDLQTYLKCQKEKIYACFKTSIASLQQKNALSQSLSVEFISVGLWVFLSGVLRTHLEMDKTKFDIESQCNTLLELWIDALR